MPDDYGLYISDLEIHNQTKYQSVTNHLITAAINDRGDISDWGVFPKFPTVPVDKQFILFSYPFQMTPGHANALEMTFTNSDDGIKLIAAGGTGHYIKNAPDTLQSVVLPLSSNSDTVHESSIVTDSGEKFVFLEGYYAVAKAVSRKVPSGTRFSVRGVVGCMVLR